jgi:ribosomal protein S27AE
MKVRTSYLNQKIISKNQVKAKAQMIIGVVMNLFYCCGVYAVIDGSAPKFYFALYIALMVPGFYLIWCSVQNKKWIKKAIKYDEIFAQDKDGVITAREMGDKLGMKYFDLFIELEKIFRRGYFMNCTLQQGRNPGVIINNAQVGDEKGLGFLQMVCPKCGASTRIRANSRGKCEYCGSIIQAPKVK